jgi:hypothetical protein
VERWIGKNFHFFLHPLTVRATRGRGRTSSTNQHYIPAVSIICDTFSWGADFSQVSSKVSLTNLLLPCFKCFHCAKSGNVVSRKSKFRSVTCPEDPEVEWRYSCTLSLTRVCVITNSMNCLSLVYWSNASQHVHLVGPELNVYYMTKMYGTTNVVFILFCLGIIHFLVSGLSLLLGNRNVSFVSTLRNLYQRQKVLFQVIY